MRQRESRYSPVPPCQFLVRNGEAGKPSLFIRFGLASFRQPKRTCVGAATPPASTTTVSPSMVASAGTNLPSAPAILKLAQRLAVARLQAAADMGELRAGSCCPRPSSTCRAAPSRRGLSCRSPWPTPRGPADCPRRSCWWGGCRRCWEPGRSSPTMPVCGIFRLAAWASQRPGKQFGEYRHSRRRVRAGRSRRANRCPTACRQPSIEGSILSRYFRPFADIGFALIPDHAADGERAAAERSCRCTCRRTPCCGHGPGLDRRAAPGAVDQPDRHVQFFVQPAGRNSRARRKNRPDRLGSADHPGRLDVLGRRLGLRPSAPATAESSVVGRGESPPWPRANRDSDHSMFDWPEPSQTSPMRMSSSSILFLPLTVSCAVCRRPSRPAGPLSSCPCRRPWSWPCPRRAGRSTSSPGSAQPQMGSGWSRCRTMWLAITLGNFTFACSGGANATPRVTTQPRNLKNRSCFMMHLSGVVGCC